IVPPMKKLLWQMTSLFSMCGSLTAYHEKAQRLEEAEQAILMLERKVKLDMATEKEKELLKQWEIYSINVAGIDTSTAPDITWPNKP
ncbi:tail fiber assembly protein, partial [Providencia rettgeri]